MREIRALLEIGFNLEDTRPFVECIREGHSSGAECPASVEVLTRRLAELDDYIVGWRRRHPGQIVKELAEHAERHRCHVRRRGAGQ